MIEPKFENPPGIELTDRQFTSGQSLRVGAHVTNFYLPMTWLPVSFELVGPNFQTYFTDTFTDIWGNAWVDWILPNVVTNATVKIHARTTIPYLFDEQLEIPISLVASVPGPGPGPGPDPSPLGGASGLILVALAVLLLLSSSKKKK